MENQGIADSRADPVPGSTNVGFAWKLRFVEIGLINPKIYYRSCAKAIRWPESACICCRMSRSNSTGSRWRW